MAADARTEKADTTLTPAERDALDAVAEEHGVSRASMVRLLVLSHLAQHAHSREAYALIANVPEVHRECRLATARLTAITVAAVDGEEVAEKVS